MIIITLLAFLLTLLSLAVCTSTTAVETLDSGYANHTADIASILSSRDTAWSPGQSRSVDLEPGLKFQICGPNPDDSHMCYVSFVEKSTWGGWAVMWAFDNSCNLRGYNDHVARNWLNGIWFFSTDLPTYLQVRIKTSWNEDKSEGVNIYYNRNHRTRPFIDMDWPVYTYKTRIQSKNPGNIYAAFRAPFRC